MPFLNGRYYANRILGRAAELARILSGQAPSLAQDGTLGESLQNITGGVSSIDVYSRARGAANAQENKVSGFCELTAGFSPHGGVHCEPGKDYHGMAVMTLAGVGLHSHSVDEDSIRVRAETPGDILTIDSAPTPILGDHLTWSVNFTIKAGPGFKEQGGTIFWTVKYKCGDEMMEQHFPQTIYCLE